MTGKSDQIRRYVSTVFVIVGVLTVTASEAEDDGTSDHLKFGGEITEEKADFTFTGSITGGDRGDADPVFSSRTITEGRMGADSYAQSIELDVNLVRGALKEVILRMDGQGEIVAVTGGDVINWSVRRDTDGSRFLVLGIAPGSTRLKHLDAGIETLLKFDGLPNAVDPMLLIPADPNLHEGLLRIRHGGELAVGAGLMKNIMRVDPGDTAGFPSGTPDQGEPEPLSFRFFAQVPSLTLNVGWSQPDAYRVVFDQFSLKGTLSDDKGRFVLKGMARVRHPDGGRLHVLGGNAALTGLPASEDFRIEHQQPYRVNEGDTLSNIARKSGTSVARLQEMNRLTDADRIRSGQTLRVPGPYAAGYFLVFDKPGEFPVTLEFDARVDDVDGWKQMRFEVAPGTLRPVRLAGLSPDTEFRPLGGGRPERDGDVFLTHLGAADALDLQWKSARPEGTGRLFYSAENLTQVSVRPGLMQQVDSTRLDVMQGEMNSLYFDVIGNGEVTRVLGDHVLEWNLSGDGEQRELLVRFNQSIRSTTDLTIHTQSTLGPFPLSVEPMSIRPGGAIRTGGFLRVVNDGSVRLEVTQASGLSQISPDRFPRWQAVKEGVQQFAYRFSDANYGLTVQADNIVPEVSVSQVVVHHVAENETTIEASLELDIREAPIREFSLNIPEDYVVTNVRNANLGDYFITPGTNATATLRIVLSQPVMRRESLYLKLERNRPLVPGAWELPRVEPVDVKTVRGHVGVSADPGLRLSATALDEALSEVGVSFFPKRVENLQLAWRWRDRDWQATINIERLEKFVQADAVHLFSIGDGIANGSSIFNYLITGSPVSTLTFIAPTNYSNIEFTGRDVRSWKLVNGVHEVYLQSPVSGAYTLLATYDRRFEQPGATLNLEGIQPTGIQAEQGYNIIVSDHQFRIDPVTVSDDLIKLESGEIPAEHLLLVDAPILDAYQYLHRPFELALGLSAFSQGETKDQVIDRADIKTEVSGEGQVLTSVQFLLKSKGRSHLRMRIPNGVELWSSQVNGSKIVPVSDDADILIPLPRGSDPNAIIAMDLNLASKSPDPGHVAVKLPTVAAPVLQTTWTMNAETNHQLIFREGALEPSSPSSPPTGYRWLTNRAGVIFSIGLLFVAVAAGGLGVRWATREGRRRFDVQNSLGICVALVAILVMAGTFLVLIESAVDTVQPSGQLSFSTPFLQADTDVSVNVRNISSALGGFSVLSLWPAAVAICVWAMQFRLESMWQRRLSVLVGWGLMACATLRALNGASAFLLVLLAFFTVHFIRPAIHSLIRVPRRDDPPTGPAATTSAATLIVLGLFLSTCVGQAASSGSDSKQPPVVTSVSQDAKAEDGALLSNAAMSWTASEGQPIDFLRSPAVLTDIEYDKTLVTLIEDEAATGPVYRLTARTTGAFEIRFTYQLRYSDGAFDLPTIGGLVNRLNLLIAGEDVEIGSGNLISQERELTRQDGKQSTRSAIVLGPRDGTTIRWTPRSRDTSSEEAVFYGEITHLLVPNAGVIEGTHDVLVRPSRGQLNEIELHVPAPFTITDVEASIASTWRFDPDTRTLRVPFKSPIASAFAVRVRSQIATQPLPYTQTASLPDLKGASDQIGTVGIATGAEVQLEQVGTTGMTPINLEDFKGALQAREQDATASLRLRRAFRYEKPEGTIELRAAPVEPDIRVDTRTTLSLGDDRTVLAGQITANITRAGIFKLSFVLPASLEVESLTGEALSHWTELDSGGARIVTMHLLGRTEGIQTFSLTLTGPGLIRGPQLTTPRLTIREAAKQQGQLTVVPELGVRLNVSSREGVTQLDPATLGIRQRGVQAFRLLQSEWSLVFDIEQVDPWIEVASLQDFDVREGQVQVSTVLDYEIQNAGADTLRVRLPQNADSVTFTGQHITDFIRTDVADGRLATWEVKLSRRLVGDYPLQLNYRYIGISQEDDLSLAGVVADGVNLQKGFVTIRASGRLEVRIPSIPPALAFTDWQTIPAALRRAESTEANRSFRVIEPDFDLAAQVVRHDVAQLLPAQVERVDLHSTMSSNGELLTEVRMWIHPGDKRLLQMKLPTGSEFWFAFVNSESASPWTDGDTILIPLDRNSDPARPATVEFFYTGTTRTTTREFDHQLAGPEFDLPLKNITWTMSLSPEWKVRRWDDRWQFQSSQREASPSSGGLDLYFNREQAWQSERTRQAESLIQKGNEFLAKGDQQLARKAYRGAMELSQHDAALNEDARVQLQNLKQQQALVGLNVRMDNAFAQPDVQERATPVQLGREANYTQQQAQQLIEQNSKEDNDAMMRVAGRLVEQQEANEGHREAIRATLPQQEQSFVFTRSLHIDKWAGLELGLKLGHETGDLSISAKTVTIVCLTIAFALLMELIPRRRRMVSR